MEEEYIEKVCEWWENLDEEDKIEKIKNAYEKEFSCPVCRDGNWNNYKGNYDELCNEHYLESEPTN